MKASWVETARGLLAGWMAGNEARKGFRVLSYHGVVERKSDPWLERNLHCLSAFRSQVKWLRRMRVLSISEVSGELTAQAKKPKAACVITFDDGYANNVIVAEILAAARLPWVLFVSTGSIGTDRPIWPVELSLLLLRGGTQRVEFLGRAWPLGSRAQRRVAFHGIRYGLKVMAAEERRRALDGVREQFPAGESERLLNDFPSLRMLSWSDISRLANAGAEIGSHGVHHEFHNESQPEEVRRCELTRSKAELETRLGRPCRFFSYPNGDFVSTSPKEVEEAGYRLAFTTRSGTVRPGASPYLLPRIAAAGSLAEFVRNFYWESAARTDGR